MGEKVGKTDSEAVEASERANPGNMYQDSYKDHLAALSLRGKTTTARYAPFEEKRDAVSSCNLVGYSIDDVLASIMVLDLGSPLDPTR